jgi:hypothetical protein
VLFFLTEHRAMKAYWGVEVQVHAFLTSALDGGEWSTSRPRRFTPRERAPGTHGIAGWVGSRRQSERCGEENNSQPLPGLEPSIIQHEDLRTIFISSLGYGLDDRGSRFRFPAGAGNFSLHHRVQNRSGAYPASCPMGTGCSFPGDKAAGAWSRPLTSI